MIDLSDTLAPKSDQLNADDLLAGPRTVTITAVRKLGGDQPTAIELEGYPGRPYKPGKSMRRVLNAAWGSDGEVYIGRRMTLYRDASVRFGKQEVGGIRISHLSDLPGGCRLSTPLTVRRGEKEVWTVEPLAESAPSSEPAPPAPTVFDHLAAAMRFAQWDQARVEQEVGHPLAAFADLTEAEAQACVDAIRAEHDAPQVEDPPYDEGAGS